MTRDEFIDYYMANSGLPAEWRTPDGYAIPPNAEHPRVALPCACGEEICRGWAMVPADCVDDHMRFYAPTEPNG